MSEQGSNPGSSDTGNGMDAPLGLQLRRARQARGWNVADVAAKLRLKNSIVEALEAEHLPSLGAPVFVRGYYASYTRLLGVGADRIDDLIGRQSLPEPVLSSSTRISTSRHLFDRYAHRAVYAVVTVSIVVPLILLATRDHLPESGNLLSPLDAPISAERIVAVDLPASEGTSGAETTLVPEVVPMPVHPAELQQPVMASMTPFYTAPRVAAPALAEETDGLVLRFSGDSWVEVTGTDGKRLEHNLVRAGEVRRYDRRAVASVLLGNAAQVQAQLDGEDVNLEPYRKANVARFEVSSEGSLNPGG